MTNTTALNDQITDSVTQVNTEVLGLAPGVSTGNFMIATSQALANAAHNATSSQGNANVTAQAALIQGVTSLQAIDTAVIGESLYVIQKK